LVKIDEKDLSTSQPPKKKNPRVHGPDGHARGTQRAQASSRKGTPSPGDRHPGQAARLISRGGLSFSPADRLHHSAEFRFLQRQGVRAESAHFVLYAGRMPGEERSRLGVTVSRRIGNAVIRNRVKRRVREIFRLRLRPMLTEGTALVVIARSGAGELATAAIATELDAATRAVAEAFSRRFGSKTR